MARITVTRFEVQRSFENWLFIPDDEGNPTMFTPDDVKFFLLSLGIEVVDED